MRDLYLENDQIGEIEKAALDQPLLKKLSLSDNQLESIEPDKFECLALEYLDLSKNRINKISARSFKKLRKLLLLDLSNNQLEAFSSHVFSRKTNLKFLYLDNNQLKTLEGRMAPRTLGLTEITLFGNEVDYLDPKFFEGLENLMIYTGQSGCFTGNSTVADTKFSDCTEIDTPEDIEEIEKHLYIAEAGLPIPKSNVLFYMSVSGICLSLFAIIMILIVCKKINDFVGFLPALEEEFDTGHIYTQPGAKKQEDFQLNEMGTEGEDHEDHIYQEPTHVKADKEQET